MVKGGNSGGSNMGTVMSWSIGVASIAFLGLIMLILFGNLSGNVGFGTDSATITNETITLNILNGVGTINDNTNVNFLSWNASLILNASIGPGGETTNETLIENTDYIIFPLNGTFQNVTGDWNRSFVTYTTSRNSIGFVNTDNFINNYTQSVLNTGEQFPTVGTIIGVALLLFILISLLIFSLSRLGKISGNSGGNFG